MIQIKPSNMKPNITGLNQTGFGSSCWFFCFSLVDSDIGEILVAREDGDALQICSTLTLTQGGTLNTLDALLIASILVGLPFFLYSRSPRYKRLHQRTRPEFSRENKQDGANAHSSPAVKIVLGIFLVVIAAFTIPTAINQIALQNATTKTSEEVSSKSELDAGLLLEQGKTLCSGSGCNFFMLKLAYSGDVPKEIFGEVCLVVDGKTYDEEFNKGIIETFNPGEEYFFDAFFKVNSGVNVSELFVGNCIQGTKIASLALDEKLN